MRTPHLGFTLVELLVSIAVIGLLAGLASLSYSFLRRHVVLKDAAEETLNALRTVQSWAISGQTWPGFTGDQCIRFTTTGYSAPCTCSGSTCHLQSTFGSGVTLGAAVDVTFKRITGVPNPLATTTLVLTAGSETKSVVVSAAGRLIIQ